MKNNEKYRISLGFKHWVYFDVKASSKEKALKKAREMYDNGKDYDGTNDERDEEFDEAEKI